MTVIDVLHSAIDALERQEFLRGVCATIPRSGSSTSPSARSGTPWLDLAR